MKSNLTFNIERNGKILGTDVGRTRDLRFTRATPYHLATAPGAVEKNTYDVGELKFA